MKLKINSNFFIIIIAVIPIILYIAMVVKYNFNIPAYEEYMLLTEFNYPFMERITKIFNHVGEHCPAFGRIFYEVYYRIFGEINFEYSAYFGNSMLIIIVAMLFKIFKAS